MKSFLKVSARAVFLLTVVLVPILLFSTVFLYLTAEKEHQTEKTDKYITLIAYQQNREKSERSDVRAESLLDCQMMPKRCQQIEKYLSVSSSCTTATENPRILVKSNFGQRAMVSSQCPVYPALKEALASED